MSVSGTFDAAAVAGLGADNLVHARHSHNDQACSVELPPCTLSSSSSCLDLF